MSNYVQDLIAYLLAFRSPTEHFLFEFPVEPEGGWLEDRDTLVMLQDKELPNFILVGFKEHDSVCLNLPRVDDGGNPIEPPMIDEHVFQSFVTIYPTGSKQPASPKWLLDYPTFQIRSRGRPGKPEEAYLVLQQVKDALLGIRPTACVRPDTPAPVIGYRDADPSMDLLNYWDSITMDTDILTLDVDSKNRTSYVMNICAIVDPVPHAGSNRESLGATITGDPIQQPIT